MIVCVSDGALAARVLAVAGGVREIEIAGRARSADELIALCDEALPNLIVVEFTDVGEMVSTIREASAGRPVGVLGIAEQAIAPFESESMSFEIATRDEFMARERTVIVGLADVMQRLGAGHARAMPKTMDMDGAVDSAELGLD
jgi:hypothetical protein